MNYLVYVKRPREIMANTIRDPARREDVSVYHHEEQKQTHRTEEMDCVLAASEAEAKQAATILAQRYVGFEVIYGPITACVSAKIPEVVVKSVSAKGVLPV